MCDAGDEDQGMVASAWLEGERCVFAKADGGAGGGGLGSVGSAAGISWKSVSSSLKSSSLKKTPLLDWIAAVADTFRGSSLNEEWDCEYREAIDVVLWAMLCGLLVMVGCVGAVGGAGAGG
jgi:hypothetical protein